MRRIAVYGRSQLDKIFTFKRKNMGNYTRLSLDLKLRKDTPKTLIDSIKRITEPDDLPENIILGPNELAYFKSDYFHPFFECERYIMLFNGDNGDWTIVGAKLVDTGYYWRLTIESEFQNHDDEIEKFIEMITPFVMGRKKKGYVGWHKGEDRESSRINIYIERPLGGFKS